MKSRKQTSESYRIGILLALVGGYLDAYTYLCRGHVFANAQTGNIVLFGVNLADGAYLKSLYYLIPILSFVLGILIAEYIKSKFKEHPKIHWRQIIIAIELLVLFGVGFIPKESGDMLANILISFVCSLQVESFRKVHGHAFATTMCTGNLRSATEQLYHYKQRKDKAALLSSLQYYGIILFFIMGAAAGSILTGILAIKAIFITCIGLLAVFLLMFKKEL